MIKYKSDCCLKQQQGNTLDFMPPVYTSFQEADAEINEMPLFGGILSGPTVSASKTPIGYRGDNKSIRQDLLTIHPKDWRRVPRKYDKYKIADRISTETPAIDPSTQGLISTAKQIATLPQYIAPIPFQKPVGNALGWLGRKTVRGLDNALYGLEHAPQTLERFREALNVQDDKLGALIERTPEINMQSIANAAEANLQKGMGIKKLDVPISLKLEPYGKHNISNRDFTVNINNSPTGRIRLEPINVNRSFTEILGRKSKYMPQFRKASGPGLQKRDVHPFTYLSDDVQAKYKGKGVYGEIEASIQKALQDNNLNLYSGGTTLSDDAIKSYERALQQGRVRNISPKGTAPELRVYEHNKPKLFNNDVNTSLNPDIAQKQFDTYYTPIKQGAEKAKSLINDPKYTKVVQNNVNLARRLQQPTFMRLQEFSGISDLQEHRRFMINNTKNNVSYQTLPEYIHGQNHYDSWLQSKILLNKNINHRSILPTTKHEVLHNLYRGDNLGFLPIEINKIRRTLKPPGQIFEIAKKYGMDPEYLRAESEIYAKSAGNLAETLNILPYSKYPGYNRFRTMLLSAHPTEPALIESFKLDTPRDYKRVFDLISGQLVSSQAAMPILTKPQTK